MTIGERIKHLRKEVLNLTQANFGEKIGLKSTAIGQMESGDRNVTDRTVILICNSFDVNENWLRAGELPIFDKKSDELLDQLAAKYNLKDAEKRAFEAYLKLSQSDRDNIGAIIRNMFSGFSNTDDSAATKEETFEDHKKKELEAYALELDAESKGEILSVSEKQEGA
ncbi:helix-turn-helix domain-containing protein [Candidatus Clostridium helianthi]|uniref:Helix-turn-helix domain-containing protein n=1 Tax=Candidatus Clostridium helianthi TaxID=3381660 RepID=A0ABW8S1P8_9CLOT